VMNPLWQIKYNRTEGSQTRLTIKAEQLPEPTEEQIHGLAMKLLKDQRPLHEEALAFGLDNYPGAYVLGRMSGLVIFHEGKWLERVEHDRLLSQT
jgi:hypothetical protein